MRNHPSRLVTILAAAGLCPFLHAADFPEDPSGWPAVTATNKPWTRWWWLGSAVDKPNLTRELEDFAKHGLGGVEICPIYGAMGAEDRFLKFLSPEWMGMLAHTTTEAKRLGLGVDMTTGTGWPFGGPQVTPEMASKSLETKSWKVKGGEFATLNLPGGNLVCLRAFSPGAVPLDLTPEVKHGRLEWKAPAGDFTVVALASKTAIQKVKRSAPGGEGSVLDPFSADAMKRYLETFDQAFANYAAPFPRAQFHDSFEYYNAGWTPVLLEKFQAARGYDLCDQLPAFAGQGDPDTVARVRADYRETLSDLHLAYLKAWHDWAKSRGGITRNQAHGSPGNLLDHYAVSEIPETEIFEHVEDNQIPMMRIAASAARLKGDTLVSSETFTWLDEHFQVTPEQLKEAADFVFLSGANHVFFHGIPYSPEDAKWPGWLFYASTHMGKNGGLWRDLSAFTGYLQRCQSILQEGKISSDVLLYFPMHDVWADAPADMPMFTLHNQKDWLHPTTFHKTSMELWNQGVTFDYASDALLAKATVQDGKVVIGGNTYSALVLPGVKRLQPATLERLVDLAAQGARLVVQDGWPSAVPGFGNQPERLASLKSVEQKAAALKTVSQVSGPILPALALPGVRQETMAASGLRFVRRTHDGGYHYFVANRGKETFDGVLPLAVPFKSALAMDPWNPEKTGSLSARPAGSGTGVPIRLEPGGSIVIRTFDKPQETGKAWTGFPAKSRSIPLAGPWSIRFTEGGPALPPAAENITLGSWTTLGPDAANFSGTASYTTTFDPGSDLPAGCRLDLGKVGNTARVILNGKPLGISWCAPHVIDLAEPLKAGPNRLEIQVTNLAANRIADLDRRKVEWKRFHEINFVNKAYKPFDASGWKPLDSGLLGPVRLLVPETR